MKILQVKFYILSLMKYINLKFSESREKKENFSITIDNSSDTQYQKLNLENTEIENKNINITEIENLDCQKAYNLEKNSFKSEELLQMIVEESNIENITEAMISKSENKNLQRDQIKNINPEENDNLNESNKYENKLGKNIF